MRHPPCRALIAAALACAAGASPLAAKPHAADTVGALDIAARLGMRLSWTARGLGLKLSDARHVVGLEADSREASVDGLKVYLGDPAIARAGRFFISRTDFERRLLPMLRPGAAGPPPPVPRTIVIDPGHGGADRGTENRRLGLMEKTFTLDTALRLKALLERRGCRVFMTRSGDYKLDADHDADLRKRGELANRVHADLFLSIHFNSLEPERKTSGTEVYLFPPEGERSSESWGSGEDDSEPNPEHAAPSPANRNDGWNAVFAHAMHRELLRDLGTVDRGEKLKHLGVLRGLNCPGILVEAAFLSNDSEARRVADPLFRQQVAEGLLDGIRAYAAVVAELQPAAAGADRAPAGALRPPTRP